MPKAKANTAKASPKPQGMTPEDIYAHHCATDFEGYTMTEAQESDLWDLVTVSIRRNEAGEVVINVAPTPEFEVEIPRDAEPEDWNKVAAGEYVAKRMKYDFRELLKVIEHKVDFALLTEPPKRLSTH